MRRTHPRTGDAPTGAKPGPENHDRLHARKQPFNRGRSCCGAADRLRGFGWSLAIERRSVSRAAIAKRRINSHAAAGLRRLAVSFSKRWSLAKFLKQSAGIPTGFWLKAQGWPGCGPTLGSANSSPNGVDRASRVTQGGSFLATLGWRPQSPLGLMQPDFKLAKPQSLL